MKTANVTLRPAILLSLVAGVTLAIGLPVSGSAQEGRTVATGSNIPLTAEAPDSYTVKPGDTVLVKSSNSAGLRFLGDRLGKLYSW